MDILTQEGRERIHLSSAFLSIQALKGLLCLLIQIPISEAPEWLSPLTVLPSAGAMNPES